MHGMQYSQPTNLRGTPWESPWESLWVSPCTQVHLAGPGYILYCIVLLLTSHNIYSTFYQQVKANI